MNDDASKARKRRAEVRRRTWRLEPLPDHPPRPPSTIQARFALAEGLRRAAFALQGIAYPVGRTPRRRWPIERIG